MSDVDTKKMYADLHRELKKSQDFESEIPVDFGYLGYEVNGVMSVVSQTDSSKFYVRLKNGNFREIPHRSRVAPTLNLPVEIRYENNNPEKDRTGYIYGINEAERNMFSSKEAVSSPVGKHTHHRGSGMEFPIDLRLLQQLSARLNGSMVVTINPGWFFTADGWKYYPGEQVDFSTYRPSAVSYKRWAICGIVPATKTAAVAVGTPIASLFQLSESSIEDLVFDDDTTIPLFAVKLYQNRNQLSEFDFVALYNIASSLPSEGKVKVDVDDAADYLINQLLGTTYITVDSVDVGGGNLKARFTLNDLPASKITSGVFDVARIPALPYMDNFIVAGDTGSVDISDGETITFTGDGGVVVTITGNTVTIDGSAITGSGSDDSALYLAF